MRFVSFECVYVEREEETYKLVCLIFEEVAESYRSSSKNYIGMSFK